MTDLIRNSRKEFQAITKEHTMTILKDDGLYRHIRCQKPGTGYYRWDLITWPGHLAITGDMESYTFARIPDMFEFFGSGPELNLGYWDEKIVAGGPVREHCPDLFKSAVVEYFMRNRRLGESADLFREIREDVLECSDFGETARSAIDGFRYRYKDGRQFEFSDWYEWDFNDWSSHYLRSLHAIVWGISQYRAAKADGVVSLKAASDA